MFGHSLIVRAFPAISYRFLAKSMHLAEKSNEFLVFGGFIAICRLIPAFREISRRMANGPELAAHAAGA